MKSRKSKKNRWMLVLFILAFNIANITYVHGTEPPILTEVSVKPTINFNAQSGLYSYQYEVGNSERSTGNLVGFDIDISYSSGGAMLKEEGLSIPYGKWTRTFEQSVPPTAKVKMIPVGMERPDKWITGLSVYGTAAWGGGDYVQLKPGQSLTGLGLISFGLPGLRKFKAEPALDFDADYYPGWESVKDTEDESKAIIAEVDEFMEKVSFKGRTIGPTAPPAVFDPVEFLDYLVSLKKDAYYQGWIIQKHVDSDCDKDIKDKGDKKHDKCKDGDKETGIMNSLDKKLTMARVEIIRGDNRAAIEKLKAFTHEVAALYKEGKEIRQAHVTSEAFALLYYNALYLIGQLGGK
jgi:hypothetical protein